MDEIKVRLKNRVLKVPAEDKEKYLQQGYTVYDTAGNVIAEPATDANKLKGAKAEIASLTEQLKAAKEEVTAAKASAKAAAKTTAKDTEKTGK